MKDGAFLKIKPGEYCTPCFPNWNALHEISNKHQLFNTVQPDTTYFDMQIQNLEKLRDDVRAKWPDLPEDYCSDDDDDDEDSCVKWTN